MRKSREDKKKSWTFSKIKKKIPKGSHNYEKIKGCKMSHSMFYFAGFSYVVCDSRNPARYGESCTSMRILTFSLPPL